MERDKYISLAASISFQGFCNKWKEINMPVRTFEVNLLLLIRLFFTYKCSTAGQRSAVPFIQTKGLLLLLSVCDGFVVSPPFCVQVMFIPDIYGVLPNTGIVRKLMNSYKALTHRDVLFQFWVSKHRHLSLFFTCDPSGNVSCLNASFMQATIIDTLMYWRERRYCSIHA